MDPKFLYSEKLTVSTVACQNDDLKLSHVWTNFFLMQEPEKQTIEAEIELLRDRLQATTQRIVRPIHKGTSGLIDSSSNKPDTLETNAASSASGGSDSSSVNPKKRSCAGIAGFYLENTVMPNISRMGNTNQPQNMETFYNNQSTRE